MRSVALMCTVATAVSLAGCDRVAPVAKGVIPVVGAEAQYSSIASAVGGRFVVVDTILSSPSADPHEFEAGTTAAALVARARVVVQNGLGYDDFMGHLESASPSTARRVIVAGDLVHLGDPTFNPHLWYAPTTMAAVARALEARFASIEPENKTYFEARLARVLQQLGSLGATILADRSVTRGHAVAVTEPVGNFLFAALDMPVVTSRSFQANVMNGIEPAPQEIAVIENQLDNRSVSLFAYNAQISDSLTRELTSRAEGAHVATLALYETMPKGDTYVQWMQRVTGDIVRAVRN